MRMNSLHVELKKYQGVTSLDTFPHYILHHWTEKAWSWQRKPLWPLWSQNAPPTWTKTIRVMNREAKRSKQTSNQEQTLRFAKQLFTWLSR